MAIGLVLTWVLVFKLLMETLKQHWQLTVQQVMQISLIWPNHADCANAHIEAWTKWPTCCRRYLQTHFLDRKLLYYDLNLTEAYFQGSNWCRKLFGAEQAISTFLNQCWPRSASPCGITTPQFKTSYSGIGPDHIAGVYHDMGLIIPYFVSQVNQLHLYFLWIRDYENSWGIVNWCRVAFSNDKLA